MVCEFLKMPGLSGLGYSLNTGQLKVNPFVVSPSAKLRRALSNHGRINRPPFDRLRANG
ncbi:protein of unknown function [Methylotuvimicrobium alcaliphilum 20Z]|uniref:Uncharacterized protein n=1 Tax=Methylotuvimicrobium alcaliphilum (strain DSM 19304 / NCIMB 14124 / VKM B-2133 / 20Z) TaxID=1091494 RepID=G4T4D1_META2|nr:protein of unknown function [Methylotuvimicrobium alcaliphilum 20Z]